MTTIAIGIDPGVNTGVAVWDLSAQRFRDVASMAAVDAMLLVELASRHNVIKVVRFEDANLRTGWFGANSRAKAQGAGSIKRECAIWRDWLKAHSIEALAVSPKDKGAKVDADRFAKLTGWAGRTNEHARDAAMLVWGLK